MQSQASSGWESQLWDDGVGMSKYVPLISGKVRSTSLTTPVTSKPLTSEEYLSAEKFWEGEATYNGCSRDQRSCSNVGKLA